MHGDALDRLRHGLRLLYDVVGRPAYRQLGEQASLEGLSLPISTAHELLSGRRIPRWATVVAFVAACLRYAATRRPPLEVSPELSDAAIWRLLYDAVDAGGGGDSRAGVAPRSPKAAGMVRPEREKVSIGFLVAVDVAHHNIRSAAELTAAAEQRRLTVNKVMNDSGVYAERERLIASASPSVATAGEDLFLRLVAVRDAVRSGARLASTAYHEVYHPLAAALWAFRMAVRADLGQEELSPKELHRVDWLDYERCPHCSASPGR